MTATEIATGSTETHLVTLETRLPGDSVVQVHKQVVSPLIELQAAALKAGFELRVCSGFRSFERQLQIWNGKVSGMRPVMDPFGHPLDIKRLSPWRQVQAILRWSALPGASRHHWGTDFDIYDARAMPEGYKIQLVPDEVQGSGLFAPMHNWLDNYLASTHSPFYRPYEKDTGGIAPERWHLSYRPLAEQYASLLDRSILEERLQRSDMLLLEVVLEHLDEIMQRYILLD
jgi:LAS superfamily LD-carboxypeptidase LdcB